MRKAIFLTILYLAMTLGLSAQKSLCDTLFVNAQIITVPLKVNRINQQWVAEYSSKGIGYSLDSIRLIEIENIFFRSAHLHLQFDVNKWQSNLTYKLSTALLPAGAQTDHLRYSSPQTVRLLPNSDSHHELVWLNALESDLEPGAEYLLLISVQVNLRSYCEDPPIFGSKEKFVYYTALTGGVAAVATGTAYWISYRQQLNELRDTWVDGAPNGNIEKAREDRNLSYWLGGIGAGILALDAIFFFSHKGRHKRKMEDFEHFKRRRTPVRIHPLVTPSLNLGFKLTLKFEK